MLDLSMEKEMDIEKTNFMMKFFVLQNLYFEEQNYLEILKGYCENSLENSDELNKIYPILNIIYELHLKVVKEAEKLISDF
ncbi:TPA: hypothetical protein IAC10_00855 [Candidatus Scatousia excrementigallinarum]|uniref:Uncharacterized protein n=1 Tax=Candidatus Scatousia excrementigallinarum TaxID=2840935 RepID=A0A9D1EWL2_9BACT|nr:hypothetical protein [Candidatus Scatousia excrementigallinarum]